VNPRNPCNAVPHNRRNVEPLKSHRANMPGSRNRKRPIGRNINRKRGSEFNEEGGQKAKSISAKLAQQRAHLDLQVNLIAKEKVAKLIALVEELRRDLPSVKVRKGTLADAMTDRVDVHESSIHTRHQSLSEILKRAERCKSIGVCSHLYRPYVNGQKRGAGFASFIGTHGDCSRLGKDKCANDVERAEPLKDAVNHYKHLVRSLVATCNG
jgi:hypothetical protein